eukprot:CAMPEP_0114342680 /NCGR_PEP_ID=MMETSP0101-20121206/9992_1 /TAXON_ID=38822 ORGANISM="Pteridomonas danica, Strain PT" /NCGR_SAMPLE_ID=MMETSP0101 /ASSEMBLY_ACC=CAM_ASM_000211 /LENGTH=92 /DNA_ID=CAMNT_0001476931 /DNA_START=618 /DNA_END=892 /DNA_ORIENTATION=-
MIVQRVMDEEEEREAVLLQDINNDDIELLQKQQTTVVTPSSSGSSRMKSVEEKDKAVNEMLKQYLLRPKDVVMIKKVGAGAFGEVFKGTCMG